MPLFVGTPGEPDIPTRAGPARPPSPPIRVTLASLSPPGCIGNPVFLRRGLRAAVIPYESPLSGLFQSTVLGYAVDCVAPPAHAPGEPAWPRSGLAPELAPTPGAASARAAESRARERERSGPLSRGPGAAPIPAIAPGGAGAAAVQDSPHKDLLAPRELVPLGTACRGEREAVKRPRSGSRAGNGGAAFNPPAVETVCVAGLLADANPFERFALTPLTCGDAFRSCVMRGEAVPIHRPSRMRRDLWAELRNVGYLQPCGVAPVWKCPLFAVPRKDGRWRLIWDGRAANAQCLPPPRVHFPSIRDDLQVLVGPGVRGYVAVDLKSWFVQLRLAPEPAAFFGAVGADGTPFRMTGLPMGWTWAPVAAHAATCILSRRAMKALPPAVQAELLAVRVYIDNIIFAVADISACDRVLATLRRTCREAGAVIKPSSIEAGRRAEWRGLTLTAGPMPSYRVAEAFAAKMRAAMPPPTAPPPVAGDLLVLCACAAYVAAAAVRPLAAIPAVMTALVWCGTVLGPALGDPSLDMAHCLRTQSPPAIWGVALAADLVTVLAWVGATHAPPTGAKGAPRAFGVSDAAGGPDGMAAYAVHTPHRMVLSIWAACDAPIADSELDALVRGTATAVEDGAGPVHWHSDNMIAVWAARAPSWDTSASRNRAVARLAALGRDGAGTTAGSVAYVPTDRILMDAATRGTTAIDLTRPACRDHAGCACPCFEAWLRAHLPPDRVGARRLRTTSFDPGPQTRVFHPGQPASAMASRFYLHVPM